MKIVHIKTLKGRYGGLSKNLSRDIQVLVKMIYYMNRIKDVIGSRKIRNANEYGNNIEAKELSAFAIMQICELGKQLTPDSTEAISAIKSGSLLVKIRNMIAHDYENTQYTVIYAFAMNLISKQSYSEVQQRIKFCLVMNTLKRQ